MIRSQPATKRLEEAVRPLRGILSDVTDRIRCQARNRGRPYLLAWAHRIARGLLVVFVSFHILTLSTLHTPERFAAWMRIYGFFLFGDRGDPQGRLCPGHRNRISPCDSK